MESTQRLAFADVLRGLASISVVIGHFIVLTLTAPELIATLTAAVPGEKVAFPGWIDWTIWMLNPPATGVAVFFLISGFVIPMSLATSTARSYLLKRFFRIYPPLWVALALTAVALFVSGTYWSRPSPFSAADYFANALLAQDLLTKLDVLTVAWTLQIEIKFYLLALVVHMALERRLVWPLYLFGGGTTAIYLLYAAGCGVSTQLCWDHTRITPRFLFWEASFITFMFIGSMFYAHFRRLITTRQTAIGVFFLFVCYQIDLQTSPLPFLNKGVELPYFWGLLIFTACYLRRDKIRLVQPFRFLADISYPLYLIHPIPGYVSIRLLMANGVPFWPAFAITLVLVVAIAAAVHAYVEAPAIALSKRIAKAWDRSRRPAVNDTAPVRP